MEVAGTGATRRSSTNGVLKPLGHTVLLQASHRQLLGIAGTYNAWNLIRTLRLGGMATHGLLLGASVGVVPFAYARQKSFLQPADALVIPGAFLVGIGENRHMAGLPPSRESRVFIRRMGSDTDER